MPLQKRISLVAAATVAVAVAFAVLISYFAVRDQLVGQVSNELRDQAAAIKAGFERGHPLPGLGAGLGGSAPYSQAVPEKGPAEVLSLGQFPLPDTGQARAVAAGTEGAFMTDVVVDGARLQMYTFQVVLPLRAVRRSGGSRDPACAASGRDRQRPAHAALGAGARLPRGCRRSPRCSLAWPLAAC